MVKARALLAALMLLLPLPVQGDERETLAFLRESLRDSPPASTERKPTDWRQTNEVKLAFTGLIVLYQRLLSTQDGPVCSFSTSCSQYAKQAFEKYGPVGGILMAADRLQRCHGMGGFSYPKDPVTGKLYDPVP
jgi:uncharacterized protein